MTKEIIRKDGMGFQGINKGVTATIGRNGVFNMIYFGFYHSVKDIIPQYQVRGSWSWLKIILILMIFIVKSLQDPTKEFFRKIGIGFVSGTIGSIANIPFDVAKSRIQVIFNKTA